MSIQYINDCRDCATPEYPCIGNACPYRNMEVHFCDICGAEVDKSYLIDGSEICIDCVENEYLYYKG